MRLAATGAILLAGLLGPVQAEGPTRVLILLLDGMNADDFYEALDGGKLPNLEAALAGGVRAERAWVGFPSFTAPMHTANLTGAWPARTDLVGNQFYDRDANAMVNVFGDTNTGLPTTDQYLSDRAVTLFEVLEAADPANVTVAAGEFMDRGADRSYWDTYRSDVQLGPEDVPVPERLPDPTLFLPLYRLQPEAYQETGFGLLTEVQFDAHMAHFGIASAGDFNAMAVWQVQTDGFGETYGPHTRKYVDVSLRNADANLGDLLGAIRNAGTFDETLIVLTADHGMRKLDAASSPAQSIAAVLDDPAVGSFAESGTSQGVWLTGPDRDEAADDAAFADRVKAAVDRLIVHEQMTIVAHWTTSAAARAGSGTIRILGASGGEGSLVVSDPGEHVRDATFTYAFTGPDPLAQQACYPAVGANEPGEPLGANAGAHCAPAGEDYPDAVHRLMGLMASPKAPDVVYSRSGTIDAGAGGTHGELDWEVTRIPLVFAGRGAASGTVAAPVRVVDIAPTILHAMGHAVPANMDGEVRCELLDPSLHDPNVCD